MYLPARLRLPLLRATPHATIALIPSHSKPYQPQHFILSIIKRLLTIEFNGILNRDYTHPQSWLSENQEMHCCTHRLAPNMHNVLEIPDTHQVYELWRPHRLLLRAVVDDTRSRTPALFSQGLCRLRDKPDCLAPSIHTSHPPINPAGPWPVHLSTKFTFKWSVWIVALVSKQVYSVLNMN